MAANPLVNLTNSMKHGSARRVLRSPSLFGIDGCTRQRAEVAYRRLDSLRLLVLGEGGLGERPKHSGLITHRARARRGYDISVGVEEHLESLNLVSARANGEV